MKRSIINYLAAVLLIAAILFVGCVILAIILQRPLIVLLSSKVCLCTFVAVSLFLLCLESKDNNLNNTNY